MIWLTEKKMASHFKEQNVHELHFLLFGKLKARKVLGPLGEIKTNDSSCKTASHSLRFPTVTPTISSSQPFSSLPPVDKWITLQSDSTFHFVSEAYLLSRWEVLRLPLKATAVGNWLWEVLERPIHLKAKIQTARHVRNSWEAKWMNLMKVTLWPP